MTGRRAAAGPLLALGLLFGTILCLGVASLLGRGDAGTAVVVSLAAVIAAAVVASAFLPRNGGEGEQVED